MYFIRQAKRKTDLLIKTRGFAPRCGSAKLPRSSPPLPSSPRRRSAENEDDFCPSSRRISSAWLSLLPELVRSASQPPRWEKTKEDSLERREKRGARAATHPDGKTPGFAFGKSAFRFAWRINTCGARTCRLLIFSLTHCHAYLLCAIIDGKRLAIAGKGYKLSVLVLCRFLRLWIYQYNRKNGDIT